MCNKVSKFYWHMYHQGPSPLFVSQLPFEERVALIKDSKPKKEHARRFRLFQPVKGNLPSEIVRISMVHDEAREIQDKAHKVYTAASRAHAQFCNQAYVSYIPYEEASKVYITARMVYAKAHQTYNEICDEYDKAFMDNKKSILALHAKECPNCPWDGDTIFPSNEEIV